MCPQPLLHVPSAVLASPGWGFKRFLGFESGMLGSISSRGPAEHPICGDGEEEMTEAAAKGGESSRPKLGKEKGHPAASALPSRLAGPPGTRYL